MICLNAKREKILKAAFELFIERGFNATTTKEIANRSGVAEGLIFYYFKDKNELLTQLTKRLSFVGSMQETFKKFSHLNPLEALTQFGLLYLEFLYSNKNFLFFIWSPEMRRNQNVQSTVTELLDSMSQKSADLLEKLVSSSISSSQIKMGGEMFLSSILTYGLTRDRDAKDFDDGEYIKNLATLVINGLKNT
ncbi:TetR/AcrR family transcriptional regulator [Peribacillus sp. SCS-155]|uniref:TetR/AcrR family transcriptional regulator n=1 Tax=Peribacillus sedimenti TaxID=3115297 RepID=UPI003906580F